MPVTNDFWLQLHHLAGCMEAEGDTRRERLSRIIAAWEGMPPLAREQVAGELAHILTELPELWESVHERLSKG